MLLMFVTANGKRKHFNIFFCSIFVRCCPHDFRQGQAERVTVICQNWNLSELISTQNWNLSEFISTQNWNLSELEFVRIGICQNWNLSELEFVRMGICQHWNLSESEFVRIRICQNWNLSELAIISFGDKNAM